MKKNILTLILTITIGFSYSQVICVPDAYTLNDTITCNDSAMIIIGEVGGSEDFSCGGPCNTGWTTIGAQFDNPYISSPDGNGYIWMGPISSFPRRLVSPVYNTSCGGTICFDFVYGNGSSPIEQPDQYDEGITLQYSNDFGATWVDIQYWAPNGDILVSNPGVDIPNVGGVGPFETWQDDVCLPIPLAAQTVSTQFRWEQEFATPSAANDWDHWGIDDVQVSINSDFMDAILLSTGVTYTVPPSDTFFVHPTTDSMFIFFLNNLAYESNPSLQYTGFDTVYVYIEETDAGPDLTVSCSTQGKELNVTGLMPYSNVVWTPSLGLDNPNIHNPYANPIDDQMYTVTSDCGVDSIFVDVVPIFDIFTNSPNDSICVNDVATLIGTANPPEMAGVTEYTYEWTNFVANDTSATTTVTPSSNTMYYLEMVSDSGCIRNDSIMIYVGVPPKIITFAGDMRVCNGDSTQITVNAIAGTIFDDFEDGPDLSIWDNISNGIANNDCGSFSGNAALHFNNAGNRWAQTISFDASLGGDLFFYLIYGSGGAPCETLDNGDEMQLEYSINNGTTWTIINTYAAGSYASFTLINETIPVAAQTNNTIFRFIQPSFFNSGDNWAIDDVLLELNCVGSGCVNYTYNWSPASTVSDPTIINPYFYPSSTTTYSVAISPVGYNCVSPTDSITISVDEMNLSINPSDTFLCGPSTLLLEASIPNCEYTIHLTDNFGNGWQGHSITVLANGSPIGTYTISTTYGSPNDTAFLGTFSVPFGQSLDFVWATGGGHWHTAFEIIDYTGSILFQKETGFANNLSAGSFLTTIADCITSVSWSGANMSATNIVNPLVSPTSNESYILSVYNQNNCLFTDTALVEIYSPNNTLTANPNPSCKGETIQLNATGADTYTWIGPDLNDNNIANPVSSTTVDNTMYYVTYETQGCTSEDSIELDIRDLPVLDINNATNPVSFCEGESVELFVDNLAGWSYNWQGTTNSTNSLTVSSGGNYVLSFNDGYCDNTAQVTVAENPKPTLDFSSFTDTILCCENDETTINFNDYYNDAINIQTIKWNGVVVNNNSYTYVSEDASLDGNATELNFIELVSDKNCSSGKIYLPKVHTKCSNPYFVGPDTIFSNTSDVFDLSVDENGATNSYLWTTTDPASGTITDATVEDAEVNATDGSTPTYEMSVQVTSQFENGKECPAEVAESKNYTVIELTDPMYPDAFTPNGDDLNNLFKPVINQFAEITEFRIYNRWGDLVYDMETAENKDGWDGKWKGVDQKTDVYTYYITVKHPDKDFVKEGSFTLLR